MAVLIVAAACSHAQVPSGDDDGTSGTSGASGAGNNTSGGASGTGNTAGTTSGAAGTDAQGGTGQGGASGTSGTGTGGSDVIIGGTGGAAGAGMPGGMAGMPMKMSCGDGTLSDKYGPGYTAARDPQVTTLLASMTMTQKIAQMQGTSSGTTGQYDDIFRSPDDTTNMIKGYMYRDGPRGVNLDAPQVGRPNAGNYSTGFPQVSARGASFDLELEYKIGEAQGDETIASGNTLMLAPCMNILRHPAWGRSQETYGEDTYHLGRMASAYTAGLQTFVAGCAKHYAGNNIEASRASNNAEMDEQTLREIYSRHFEMVVKEGGVACVMAAYNKVQGAKSTENKHLLTDVLKTGMGFRGFVLSDWWAVSGGTTLADSSTRQNNAANAVNAGLDIELPWNLHFEQLQAVVTSGRVQASAIDNAVGRILEQKFRFKSARIGQAIGLRTPTTRLTNGSITNNDAHITLAQEAAEKSMVLLKNANSTLPIRSVMDGGTIDKVAVVGLDIHYELQSTTPTSGDIHFATDQPLGDRGSSRVNTDPAKTTGPAAGMMAAGGRHGVQVVSGNSVNAVGDADFVVVVVGLTPGDEGEEYAIPAGGDRANFQLPGSQNALVTAVAGLGKPFVVVIESGSVVEMPWLAQAPAVVMEWYAGQAGGLALGRLLFGEANFSGKLPMTWANYADFPAFKGSNGNTTMDYFLGYRHFDQAGKTPVFPFGHGLSYSTFVYSNLQVPCSDVTKGGVVNVTVDIANTSAVAGEEIAFLFVSFPSAARRMGLAAGYKELKAFRKVQLDGMTAKRVTIPLKVADLNYWSGGATGQWVVESGAHTIMVGPSSKAADLTLRDTLPVQ